MISYSATPKFIAARAKWDHWGLLLAGLAVTGLAAFFLFFSGRHAEQIEKSTQELSNTNALLTQEMMERRQAEDTLHEKERLLSESQRLGHVGSFLFDTTGFLEWSEELYHIYGVLPDTFTPKMESLLNLIHPEDQPSMQAWTDACMAGKKPATLEFRVIFPDGTIHFIRGDGEAVFDDENRFLYLAGSGQDITERKLAEERLRYKKTVLSILLRVSPSAILVVDENARIVSCNEEFIHMWDLPREMVRAGIDEPVLRKVFEQIDNPEEFLARVQYLYEHKEETSRDEVLLLDGRIIDRHSSPITDDDGRYYGRVWDFRDITELKRATQKVRQLNEDLEAKVLKRTQQLLDAQEDLVRKAKLALLGQVVGSVGHELRNPLAVMNNAVYFLQTVLADADETTREYLEMIKTEIADADRIVSGLLDSVRTKPPQPVEVGVGELIELTLHKVNVDAAITVMRDIPKRLPPVRVDAGQVQQVFRNLISNSVEAMPEGGTLTIRAVENRLEGTVTVIVRDSGGGIAPEVMARLFQPLFTTKARGIGLGLVVVKNLTEANGGNVGVESVPGEGSRFFITLPSGEGDMPF